MNGDKEWVEPHIRRNANGTTSYVKGHYRTTNKRGHGHPYRVRPTCTPSYTHKLVDIPPVAHGRTRVKNKTAGCFSLLFVIPLLLLMLLLLPNCIENYHIKNSTQDLNNAGYIINQEGSYELPVTENGSILISLNEDGTSVQSINAYIVLSDYKKVELEYFRTEEGEDHWNGCYHVGGIQCYRIEPNDLYEYIKAVEPKVITELNKLIEYKDIDTAALEGGDKTIVEEVVKDTLVIHNIRITDVTGNDNSYDNSIQVNFDITNISDETLDLEVMEADICYEVPNQEENACVSLYDSGVFEENNEIYVYPLSPGETANLQFTVEVDRNASNYYVYVYYDYDAVKSEVVNK